MRHLPMARPRRARRGRQAVTTAGFAMVMVLGAFASPALAAGATPEAPSPSPSLRDCRADLERTGRVSQECAPHRQTLLDEQRAAEQRAAEQRAAEQVARDAAAPEPAQEPAGQPTQEPAQAPSQPAQTPPVAQAVPADCTVDQVYNPLTEKCDDIPIVVQPCDQGEDFNGPLEDGCGTDPNACDGVDFNGPDPGCGTPPDEVVPCETGEDFNGPSQDGCGTDPEIDDCEAIDYNGDEPGCGSPPGGGGSPGGGNPGTGGGAGNPGAGGGGGNGDQIGSVTGRPEGNVAGAGTCGGSVACQSTAPTTTTTTTAAEGLPDTGAPDSNALVLAGLALLAGGAYLLRPRRRVGRHQLLA